VEDVLEAIKASEHDCRDSGKFTDAEYLFGLREKLEKEIEKYA